MPRVIISTANANKPSDAKANMTKSGLLKGGDLYSLPVTTATSAQIARKTETHAAEENAVNIGLDSTQLTRADPDGLRSALTFSIRPPSESNP